MKILFSLLALMLLNKECSEHKTVDATKTTTTSENSANVDTISKISYEAMSRGFYEQIWVTKDAIMVSNDRNQSEKTSIPMPQKEWNELLSLVQEVDVKSLPELEDPTQMRFYDGAAIATFSIEQGTQEFKTESFDHGHPPKAIEALVNKVLSMKELSKKQ